MTTRAEEPLSIVQETTRTRLSLGRQRLAPPQLVAICLSSLGAICALIALWQSWPVECSVAGVPYRLRHGARIQEALKAAQIDVRAGDLISLRGAVLQPGGGALPSVWREGQSVALSEFVRAHDRLIVVPATDMREPVFEKAILLPPLPKAGFLPAALVGTQRLQLGRLSGEALLETTYALPTVRAVSRYAPRKCIALTFDDGPWPGTTAQILDVLDQYGAKATFFVLGTQARANADLLRRVRGAGHEIGIHTWRHSKLTHLSFAAIVADLRRCQELLTQITGEPVRLMRPPYGAINASVQAASAQLGLRPVLWTSDTQDWRRPGEAAIFKRIMSSARPGAIILCHDGGGNRWDTLKAIQRAVPALLQQGYKLVTVSELLGLRPPSEGGMLVLPDGRQLEILPVQPPVGLSIDGEPQPLSEPLLECEGQLLLPVRPTLERLGIKWTWNQQAQRLWLRGPFEQFVVGVNSLRIQTSPTDFEYLSVPPVLYRHMLFVPLWLIMRVGQAQALYNPPSRTLHLMSFARQLKGCPEKGYLPPEQWGRGISWRAYLSGQ